MGVMCSMKNKSVLDFIDYRIDKFIFQKNEEFRISEGKKVEVDFNFSFGSDQKDEIFERKITCDIFDEDYKNNDKPFYLSLTLTGKFRIFGFEKGNEMHDEIIKKNTLAILFPYVRSIISHMTLEMQIEPVTLPPLNINSFFEEAKE